MQRNWIGRSEGAEVEFPVVEAVTATGLDVFTTRIDTIYGATFVLLAPEHPLVDACRADDPQAPRAARCRFRAQDRRARMTGEVEKEGFFTGRYAINPVHRRARAHLDRQLRAGRLRHGRRHGGAGARPARLRVRDEATACPSAWWSRHRRPSPDASTGDDDRSRSRTTACSSTPASGTACRRDEARRRWPIARGGASARARCSSG